MACDCTRLRQGGEKREKRRSGAGEIAGHEQKEAKRKVEKGRRSEMVRPSNRSPEVSCGFHSLLWDFSSVDLDTRSALLLSLPPSA